MTTYYEERRKRLREELEPSTFLDHVEPPIPGRFAEIDTPHIVGSAAIPKYPELPDGSPFHHDPCGPEPSLGLDNPALSVGPDYSDRGQGAPDAPTGPSVPVVETGASLIGESKERIVGELPSTNKRDVGSSPTFRRF
jgi:hypothetical protein